MPAPKRPFDILIVDDNVPDMELLKFLFNNCDIPINFHCAYDGAHASDFLFRRDKFAGSAVPDLVILDLNLPRKDGREVLKEMKADKDLCKIPVIMLSTSSSQREVVDAYCLGASAFISKPSDLEAFQKIVHSLTDFWFRRIDLPTRALM